MKEKWKILIVAVLVISAGGLLYMCKGDFRLRRQHGVDGGGVGFEFPGFISGSEVRDTITVYDTIPYIAPAPVSSELMGYKEIALPVKMITGGKTASEAPSAVASAQGESLSGETAGEIAVDSVKVRLPVVQEVYEGEEYKAYVSGVYPRLDSIFVYPKRETVTIKKPPKRWHIGPAVGVGYTPHGFQPFVGVSLTYSIISF